MSSLRQCVLEKGPNGYGFHLHGEKGKTGQFVRLVEPDTPASRAGLLAGDRLVFVNGDSVEGESHQQVVSRIRAATGVLELIVVDADTAELLKKHNLKYRKEYVTEGIPLPRHDDSDSDHEDRHSTSTSHSSSTPREATPVSRENGDASSVRSDRSSVSSKGERGGPRPRLCHMAKGSSGYGFNLHSDKNKPGQFIRAVDEDSPAERAGLRPNDKIIQVNGRPVLGMQHSEVVAFIRSGGDETTLLVVDAEAEEFFKRCRVQPSEVHITGMLPEPVSGRASDEEEHEESVTTTYISTTITTTTTTTVEELPSPSADMLGLNMSLAEAKERARQNRMAKKAPSMDWSKKNEIFSSL
ncbi:uncharacterized protein V6R79_020861 [Siganus canaliculatus]